MSREVSTANLAEINSSHLHPVSMVHLAFDEPVFVHSGIGLITFDSNEYIGIGGLGQISSTKELEELRPYSLTLSMSGINQLHIKEALDSGRYGDVITIFEGYRQDDGTLVDDPIVAWRGNFDHAALSSGLENTIALIVQHDLDRS